MHDQALYAGAAYLYNLLLQGNTDRKNIQDAVWVLMDPSFKNDLNSADKNSTFYSYLNAAQNPTNYTPFESLSDFYILSDTSSRNKNQEFLVYIPSQNSATPEPGTLAMFGIFFILAGAGIRFAKKRNATA
mgnify:FL=1